jgi:hypothetical protein
LKIRNAANEGEEMITATLFQDCLQAAALERRRFQRLKKAVQAELRTQDSETPIRTETADISAGGCYIEMAVTLEVGTALKIVLWLGHKKLSLDGSVVTRHPQFGNGIEFGRMPEEARTLLLCFLERESADPAESDAISVVEGLMA